MADFNVKDIRIRIPGMSEEFYALCEYYAQALNGHYNATAGIMTLVCVMDDLDKGRCGFAREISFPEIFKTRKPFVIAVLPKLCYFWDRFFPEEAEEFRSATKETLHWDVAPLVASTDVEVDSTVPDYVRVAAEWWLNQIQHPSHDNGEPSMAFLVAMLGSNMGAKLDAEQAKEFVDMLSAKISEEIEKRGECELRVDYEPWGALGEIEDHFRFGQFSWPCKTYMRVTPESVSVSCGYDHPTETLWPTDAANK